MNEEEKAAADAIAKEAADAAAAEDKKGEDKTDEEVAAEALAAKEAEDKKGEDKTEEELAADKKAAEESDEKDTFDYSQYEFNEDGQKEIDTGLEGLSNEHKKQVLDLFTSKIKEAKDSQETEEQVEERQKVEQKEITDAWDKQSREDPLLGKDFEKDTTTIEEVLKNKLSEEKVKALNGFIFMKHPIMRELLASIGNDYNDDKIEYGKPTSGDGVKRDMHGNIILSYDKPKG